MQLHRDKSLNYGFVILSPDRDIGRIKTTINSIKRNDDINASCVVACSQDTTAEEMKEIKEICSECHRGKNTITSLINKGMLKGHKEWNVIIIEGTVVRRGVMQKYARFVENEKDILFPIVMDYDREGNVVNTHANFIDSSINGLMMHQGTFKSIGAFGDNPLEIERLLWATEAMEKGCRFKAILGTKLI
jgi:hypothetical protein